MRRSGLWAVAAISWAGAAWGATQVVDLRTGEGMVRRGGDGMGAACLRSAALPAGAALAERVATGDVLEFLLFRDTDIRVRVGERMETPLGGEAFLGEVEGYGGVKNAVVLQTAEGLTVDIQDYLRGRVYSVVSDADGVAVREFDPSLEAVVPSEGVVPERPATGGRGAVRGGGAARGGGDQVETVVDVLVAYDKPAAEWVRRNGGGTTNFATVAVQKVNMVLENGGLSKLFRYRLVGVETVEATGGSDFGGVLEATCDGEGAWGAIRAKREEVGADVVTTMIDTGSASGVTGLGYSLEKGWTVPEFSEYAYNVCSVRAVAQGHTMAHETGHNLGAGHAAEVDPEYIDPGPQFRDYASGYHFTGTNGVAYHTIMAYYYDGFGNTYAPVPFFSSPERSFMGVPVGDAMHDNARTLGETHEEASQWRAQKVPLSYDVFFSPEGGTTFSESLVVALAPGKAGLPIRYTLDGSAPTLSSALYDGPIRLTGTTTIRAATVTDGIVGPVFEATYSVSDLGVALDAPQLAWLTNPNCPWTFVAEGAYDGADAAQSGDNGDFWADDAWLSTTVEGPTTMSFRYKVRTGKGRFSVFVDEAEAFGKDHEGVFEDDWHLEEVAVPSGAHAVKFLFSQQGSRYGGFNGAWLDTVRFDALSRPPTVYPASSADLAAATTFQGTLSVTMAPPEGADGILRYTLDGTDPASEGGIEYAGPIVLSGTTFLRAVFVEPDKEPSVEVGGFYLERHPVSAGEWTSDVDGAREAARRDGRLVAVLSADVGSCPWSRALDPVAEGPDFLAWAKANGIYLVSADFSRHPDARPADDWFWRLYDSSGDAGGVYYPTLYFANPEKPDVAIGKGLARNDADNPDAVVGSVRYLGTAESLIEGVASVLGETVPQAPVCLATNPLVDAFPLTVALSNPNKGGTLRYTLDGTLPTRTNGAVYSGPVTISGASEVLRAAVWPETGVSSPLAIGAYKSVADVLGTEGVVWRFEGTGGWREEAGSPGVLRSGGMQADPYEAKLRATVPGKGKLVFRYVFQTWTWQNTFAFAVNGSRQWEHAYVDTTHFEEEVAAEGTTFEWTYTVGDASRDYGEGYTSQAGVWLSGVRWIPEGGDVVVDGVAVPREWLDRHYPGQGGSEEAYGQLAEGDSDGDGFAAWQEFLLGTDPTNGASRLAVSVGVGEGGRPVFGWGPTNGAIESLGYRYVPIGRKTMDDKEGWRPYEEGEHCFFSVFVEPAGRTHVRACGANDRGSDPSPPRGGDGSQTREENTVSEMK